MEALRVLTVTPLFSITLTLGIYAAALYLYRRTSLFLFHPVLTTFVVIIVFLKISHIEYAEYYQGGKFIHFFLAPSVVALGMPLYDRLRRLRREAPVILINTVFVSAAGIVSVMVPLMWAGVPDRIVISLAPKSVTTPIAIAISEATGGVPSLTAAVVVATGIIGAVIGPAILRLVGVTGGIPFGLAMGNASHGIGTARALEEGETEGAAAGLAICLNGIMTSVLTPLLVRFLL